MVVVYNYNIYINATIIYCSRIKFTSISRALANLHISVKMVVLHLLDQLAQYTAKVGGAKSDL